VLRIDWSAAGVTAAQLASAFELGLSAVVARLAQALPVRLVPEQHQVATVRDDMIDARRCNRKSLPLAISAKRMLPQETSARRSPASTVVTIVLGVLSRCVSNR
jgi:hypothetical protein